MLYWFYSSPHATQFFLLCSKFLLDALEKIPTRGYDGAGMATMTSRGGTMVSNEELRAHNRLMNT